MTTFTLDGFLSKKEIESAYGRSFRSLTRDITRAVKAGDADVLRHLKLVTEDELVREGTDVTLDMIQELSNAGQRPMWLVEEGWVADWITRRPTRRGETVASQSSSPANTRAKEVHNSAPPVPAQSAPAPLLLERIKDQQQQINFLRRQMDFKDDQIRTANQLAEQNQQLMQNLQVLLKNVQDGLLGEGSRRFIPARTSTKPTESTPQSVVQQPPVQRTPRRPAKKSAPQKKKVKTLGGKAESDPGAAGRLQRWLPTLFGPKGQGK
jgi:hypothetical protein